MILPHLARYLKIDHLSSKILICLKIHHLIIIILVKHTVVVSECIGRRNHSQILIWTIWFWISNLVLYFVYFKFALIFLSLLVFSGYDFVLCIIKATVWVHYYLYQIFFLLVVKHNVKTSGVSGFSWTIFRTLIEISLKYQIPLNFTSFFVKMKWRKTIKCYLLIF